MKERDTLAGPGFWLPALAAPIVATVGIASGNGFARMLGLEGSPPGFALCFVGGCAATMGWVCLALARLNPNAKPEGGTDAKT